MTDPAEVPKALATTLAPDIAPPALIELDGFSLRRPTPSDAEELHQAVKATFAELHPWMPWCTDPVELEEQRAFIERAATNWASQAEFNWFIVDTEDALIGTISLMDRIGPGGLEIGYWLRTDATGRGVMTRAAGRVTEVALGLPGIERVEIHCDAANLRSAAVPQRLGFRLAREFPKEPTAPGERGLEQQWVKP